MLTYKVPEGKSGQQTVDVLEQRLGDLGAVKTGNFTVDCDTYQSVQSNSKYIRWSTWLMATAFEADLHEEAVYQSISLPVSRSVSQ